MSEPSAGASPRRILVVDDEEDVRLLLRRVLLDTGYEVDTAEEGDEAIRKIGEARPDLVVLDLMMPGTDGWGVLAHLRRLPDPPPVLIVTARGDEEAFTEGVRAGAAAYVTKPFHFRDLLEACRKVLGRAGGPQPAAAERRSGPRRDLMVKVRVLSKEKVPVALGELANLSPGGAQVDLLVPLEPGTHVRVALHVSAADVGLKFEGRVQWRSATDVGFAHGLEFVDVGPELRAHLEKLLGPPA